MNTFDVMKARYSVRSYKQTPVEPEKLQAVLEAGRVAPTACNNQPQKIYVVQTAEGLERLAKAANIHNPPLALIICANRDEVWVRPTDQKDTCDIDASIVTDHMMLRATELGLGSLWICMFNSEILRKEFQIPENLVPVNILVLGYAEGEALSPDRHEQLRKPLSETVIYPNF